MIFHLIHLIWHSLMCCVECAEQEDERQREVDQVRLAREAEIRRTNQLFHQQRRCQQQPGRIHAGTIVDVRGSMLPAKLKPDPVPAALPSFTHSQRAPPRSRAPPPVTRRRTSSEHEDGGEVDNTTEFTPLI